MAGFRKHGYPLNLVVNLDVPDEVILSRISDRWVHLPSGRVYNLSYNRPRVDGLDDETGEPLTKRPDDNPVRYHVVTLEWFHFLNDMTTHGLALSTIAGNFCSPSATILFNNFAALAILQHATVFSFPRPQSKTCSITRQYVRRNMATVRSCCALDHTRP